MAQQPFVHLELASPNVSQSKDFYGKLFGWTFTDNEMGGGMVYSMFKPDSGPGGGMFTMDGGPTFWLAYIGVDDINVATDKAVSLGAKVHRPPMEVPGHGWMTILADPTGAAFALWQAKA